MKKNKVLISVLATCMLLGTGAGVVTWNSDYASSITVNAENADGGVIDSSYTVIEMNNVVNSSETGKYFNTETDNGAPYLTSWGMDYVPLSTDAIKRVRNGVTEDVAVVGARTIIKQGATNYYFETATSDQDSVLGTGNSNIDYQEGDIFIFNGLFKGRDNDGGTENDNYALKFENCRFIVGANNDLGVLKEVDGGAMSSHSDGYGYSNGSLNGFHFSMPANGAAYNSNWSVAYKPTSAENVKLTRNGVTTSIGCTDKGTITKFGETGYYFGMEAEKLGDLWPMQVGDVITISGGFEYQGTTLNIPETTISIYDGGVVYSSDTVVEAGYALQDAEGGQYFNMAENAAPIDGTWADDYVALNADAIQRVRGDETENVAVVGARTIVKLDTVRYYLDGLGELQEGDIFIINGLFKGSKINNNTYVIKIAKSALKVVNGGLVAINPSYTFTDEDGTQISTSGVLAYGSLAVAPETTPTKDADASYTYTFDNWYVGEEVWDTQKAYEGNTVIMAKYNATPIEYTVTFVADGATVGKDMYTVEDTEITVPEVPAKEGYTGVWETYELATGDVTVNAVYTVAEYTVTFVADGVTVGMDTYTVEDTEITIPEVPAKAGYTSVWETYELTTGDVTVNAVYTAIEYAVTFVADGETVGTDTYTVEDTEITVPEVPAKEGYAGVWETYELTAGDVTVNAIYTEIPVDDNSSSEEDDSSVNDSASEEDSSSETDNSSDEDKASNTDSSSASGCFGSVSGASIGVAMLGAAVVALLKKKEN